MGAAQRVISLIGGTLAALCIVGIAQPQVARAQVGLTSGMAQVALVARIAPHGSIQGVSSQRETGRVGMVQEASVTVRVSANTGYQLVVRGTGVPSSRIWVRAASGEFQELTANASVIVARGGRAAGQWEREVSYRIESPAENASVELPVRYEIVVSPTI